MRLLLVIGLLVVGIVGCESDGKDDAGGDETCSVSAPTECPSDAPTYADVEPIFAERCVTCHNGIAEEPCTDCWALTDHGHVSDWSHTIRGAMLSCSMPPVDSGMSMTNTERMEILEWIRCGSPE
jgi:uncharacterized membrane protein